MKTSRNVRTLYAICLAIFLFIFWISISHLLFEENINVLLLFIGIADAFLMQFLKYKGCNKYFCILIPVILNCFLKFDDLYIFSLLLILYSFEESKIDYDTILKQVKNAIWVLLVLGIFLLTLGGRNGQTQLRFYLIFLPFTLLLLREARMYYFNLKRTKALFFNTAIGAALISLSSDKILHFIFSLILFVTRICLLAVSYILYAVLKIMELLLGDSIKAFIYALVEYIRSIFSKYKSNINNTQQNNIKNPPIPNINSIHIPPILAASIKVLLVLIIIVIAYLLISSRKGNSSKDSLVVSEIREKIKAREISNKKASKVKDRSIKGRLLNIYRNFEIKTYKKGLYKFYMSASELKKAAMKYTDESSISKLTELYNTTKFSKKKTSEDDLMEAAKLYGNIKNKL